MKEQILKLRSEGKSYRQIENELDCSRSLISYHCGNGQKEKSIQRQRRNRKERKLYTEVCENCNKKHSGLYGSGRFCSKSCVSSFAVSKVDAHKLTIAAIKNNSGRRLVEGNKKRGKEKRDKKELERLNKEHICENCHKKHEGLYASGRFCSDKCARSFSSNTNRIETNKKVSQKMIGRKYSKERNLNIKNAALKYWENYKKQYGKRTYKTTNYTAAAKRNKELAGIINPNKKCKYCKEKGGILFHGSVCSKCKTEISILYRVACRFKFNVYKYPEYFDLSLIERYGWYMAKNRGNNLNGISRDHLYSVIDGFKNEVDPKIISHPTNCILMRHTDNQKKHSKSKITIEELKERIKNWANG